MPVNAGDKPDSDSSRGPFGRPAVSTLCLLLLVAGALASLFWLVHPHYDAVLDGSLYILLTRSILAGDGYSYLGIPFIVRPPGFSLILAPVIAAFGTNFRILNLVVSLFGVAGVAVLFCHARERVGPLVALALGIAVWINPVYQRLCTQVMSDVPGAALMLACLLVERRAGRSRRGWDDLFLGVMLAAAAAVRSMNLLLVPAIVAGRLLRDRSSGGGSARSARRLAVVTGVPILILLPWAVRNAVVEVPSPAEQFGPYSYWVAMWHVDREDPDSPLITTGDLGERVATRARQVVSLLGSRMESDRGGTGHLAVGAALLALWAVALVRRREAPEILAGCIMLLLLVYFGWKPRLILPVYLIVLPACAETLVRLLQALPARRTAPALVASAAILLGIADADPRGHWESIEKDHTERAELSAFIASRYGPDVRLAAILAHHHAVYLERPVYSLRIATRRLGNEGARRIFEKHDIRVVIIDNTLRGQELLRHLAARHGIEKRIGRLAVIDLESPPPDGEVEASPVARG